MDGWSLPVLFREALSIHDALVRGQSPSLPAPTPLREYIRWLKKQDQRQAEAFWREELDGITAPTPLLEDVGPGRTAAAHEMCHSRLPAAVTGALMAFARAHHLTPSTLVQGAWALLLARYSGERDVVFGATVSGRPASLEGIDSMVGMLINTLPVRVGIEPALPVAAWLAGIQERQVAREQHAFASLVTIQKCSAVPTGTPLFESLFVLFQNYPQGTVSGSGLQLSQFEAVEETTYPLTLVATPGAELALDISYDAARFQRATIERMLGHLARLLEGIVSDPALPLACIPMLHEQERELLLRGWNETARDLGAVTLVHQRIAEHARRAPDAIAVELGEDRLGYAELDARANQLARYLARMGVGPETLVAVCLPRSLELIVAILGILKAGGAYLPLDPAYPEERLTTMVTDSAAPVLVTTDEVLGGLPEWGLLAVCLDADEPAIASMPDSDPNVPVRPGNAAYVIYTSGSTGRPKGVVVEHRSWQNLAAVQTRAFDVTPASAVLQFASASFDASVWEIGMALCSGARLCLATKEDLAPGPQLLRLLRERRITHVTLPPAALAVLPREALPDLEVLIVAGEACPYDLAARWAEGRRLVNAYGPTEFTVCGTFAEGIRPDGRLPIGRPLPNVRAYLLDGALDPAPVGVAGELYLGGAGLARSYLNRPDATAERFVPDPFSGEPGARLYRTGDRARYLPDGNIEFLGRTDPQIKVRGHRIEPGEIEAALCRHPEVQQALVMAREHAPGEKQLVAYFVPDGEDVPSAADLRALLAGKLPDYMLPALYIPVMQIPLTPSGKVDTRALPAPGHERRLEESSYVAPRSPAEQQLAAVWSAVLGVERVGVEDNFFELGGDSILAIQIIARAHQLGLRITLNQLFQKGSQTIAALAAGAAVSGSSLAEQEARTGEVLLTPIVRRTQRTTTRPSSSRRRSMRGRSCSGRPSGSSPRTTTRCACASRGRPPRRGCATPRSPTRFPSPVSTPAAGRRRRSTAPPRPRRPAWISRRGRSSGRCSSSAARGSAAGCCSSSTTSPSMRCPGPSLSRISLLPTRSSSTGKSPGCLPRRPRSRPGRAACTSTRAPRRSGPSWVSGARSSPRPPRRSRSMDRAPTAQTGSTRRRRSRSLWTGTRPRASCATRLARSTRASTRSCSPPSPGRSSRDPACPPRASTSKGTAARSSSRTSISRARSGGSRASIRWVWTSPPLPTSSRRSRR